MEFGFDRVRLEVSLFHRCPHFAGLHFLTSHVLHVLLNASVSVSVKPITKTKPKPFQDFLARALYSTVQHKQPATKSVQCFDRAMAPSKSFAGTTCPQLTLGCPLRATRDFLQRVCYRLEKSAGGTLCYMYYLARQD
jgi:hypothetical protein